MPTIQDVARDAGVSTATVSRVFSAPDLVLEGTRQKVMEAVARLGYEPNFAAKSLRTLRTEKILVTVPDISNPFFSRVIRGVEEAAHAAGYSVLLGDTRHQEESKDKHVKDLAGVVVTASALQDTADTLSKPTEVLAGARALGFDARVQIVAPPSATGVWSLSRDSMSYDSTDPTADRTVRLGILGPAVLVGGAAGRTGLLTLERLAELTLGLVGRC